MYRKDHPERIVYPDDSINLIDLLLVLLSTYLLKSHHVCEGFI
jgi:hypothetical protein